MDHYLQEGSYPPALAFLDELALKEGKPVLSDAVRQRSLQPKTEVPAPTKTN